MDAFEAAVEHHRAGRLEEAEQGYRAVLAADPDRVRALHNLGLLLVRRQAFGEAEGLLARLKAAPDGAAEAVRLETRLAQAWGISAMQAGRPAEAEPHLRRACELLPDDAGAHGDLGLALLRLDRPDAAAASLTRALELAPDDVRSLVNLGSAERVRGRTDAAAAAYRRALQLAPGHAAAARNLTGLLIDAGRYAEALDAAEAGWKASGAADLLLARGNALTSLGRFDDALDCYQAAVETEGLRYEALTQVARTQATLLRHQEALETLDRAVALDPQAPLARYRRSFLRLLMCDFAGGWDDYEQRLLCDEFLDDAGRLTATVRGVLEVDAPLESLAGRRVLLVAEQGIGDQVMFASILPEFAKVAGSVTAPVDARLVRLFSHSIPGVEFLPAPGSSVHLSDYEKVMALGSLGRLFRRDAADFPRRPYLAPRPAVRGAWEARLGPRPKGLRIGLSWRGGSRQTGTARRSMELAELAPLLALPHCEFVSLQYGEVAAEVAAANAVLGSEIRVFPVPEIDDFEDLAGLVLALDVVVSVQTSLVHLCGAVGQECLTLLPRNPEWRYTLTSQTMPWYGSVRLFRQQAAGAWEPVVQRVTDVLKDRLPTES